MPFVHCAHCGMKQHIPNDQIGEMVDCPGCNVDFEAFLDDDEPAPRPRRSSRSRPRGRRTRSRSKAEFPPAIFWGLAGAVVLGSVGLFMSQFYPVFGGVIEKALAKPFSPARLSLIPIHLFAFGLAGTALGVGAFLLKDRR